MRVLLWHVHGSWTTAFGQGRHEYLILVTPDRGPDGLGRARTWSWPASAVEVTREEAAEAEVDVVVLQRPHELDGLAQAWLGGRRPGWEVPAVYLEHNAPQGRVNELRHVAADRDELGLALARSLAISDRLLEESAAWIWVGGAIPSTAGRSSRGVALIERYADRLGELLDEPALVPNP